MKRRAAMVTIAGILGLLVSSGSAAERFDDARTAIEVAIASGEVPAFAVGVSRGDDILWKEAFGLADPARGIAATVETMFSLASVSKPITATALMVLVERGEIDLDRPMNDYLGTSPLRARRGNAAEATVRRVASQTAGLPLHHHFFPVTSGRRPPPMAATIRRYGNLVTPPGERFQYSNLGYGVIERALEIASDEELAGLVEQEVFRPLGMKEAALVLDPEAETRSMAMRHDEDGRPLPFYDFDHRGASGFYASVRDLLRFGMFHAGVDLSEEARVLSKRSLREMQKPVARMPGGAGYGIGWRIRDDRWPERLVEHGGAMPGVSTSLTLVPSRKLVVVALASTRTDLPDRVTEMVLSDLLRRHSRAWFRPSPARTARARSPRRERREPTRELRGVWKGAIAIDDELRPLVLSVDEASGVRVRVGEGEDVPAVGVAFGKGALSCLAPTDLEIEEIEELDALLRFRLLEEDGTLSGAVTVLAEDEVGLPMAVSFWAELSRVPADGER